MQNLPENKELVPCEPCVLLADDEEAITTLFKAILQKEFSETKVDLAPNGQVCIDLFKENHHQLILMDLHMPLKDGLCAFQELRELCDERNWQMPAVIFFTGLAPPDTVREVIDTDPRHGVLMKPVALETLLEAVRQRIG